MAPEMRGGASRYPPRSPEARALLSPSARLVPFVPECGVVLAVSFLDLLCVVVSTSKVAGVFLGAARGSPVAAARTSSVCELVLSVKVPRSARKAFSMAARPFLRACAATPSRALLPQAEHASGSRREGGRVRLPLLRKEEGVLVWGTGRANLEFTVGGKPT